MSYSEKKTLPHALLKEIEERYREQLNERQLTQKQLDKDDEGWSSFMKKVDEEW